MKYMGGKSRIAKPITNYLNKIIIDNNITTYIEPFCGACWITQEINPLITRIACDAHKSLVMLFQALQAGWLPPDEVSEEEYAAAKLIPDCALKAFIGFGCSFSGKYWGGYARCKTTPRNYCGEAKRTLLKKISKLQNVYFSNRSYDKIPTNITGRLIYNDPPYQSTTGYGGIEKFDSDKFWQWAREMSRNNYVFTSEYVAPPDFTTVLEISTKTDMSNKEGKKDARIEKLFRYKG